MKKKLISFLFTFIFVFFPLVSAGLVIENEPLNITKDLGSQRIVEFTVKNNENLDFYNLKFEEDWITFDTFNLSSGQNKTFSARININSSFDGELTLLGEYERNIGQSNKTEIINIDYDTGIDKCGVTLVKGDSVTWVNNVNDEIILMNYDTQQNFKTILEGKNHTINFSSPETLNYLVKRIGVPFTSVCQIEVQSDSGLVHNSEYDATIGAKIRINYPPTTVNLDYFENDYHLTYSQSKEDFLKIENTGNNTAKVNIRDTKWIEFDNQKFDLDVGESKTIGYTILPEVFTTNETNKTHKLNLTIEGNFPKINDTFNIFIPYANLDGFFLDDSFDEELIRNFFRFWCKENPSDSLCMKEAAKINGSTTTVEYSSETIKSLIERQATVEDEQEIYRKNDLEFKSNQTQIDKNQTEKISILAQEQKKTNDLLETLNKTLLFVIILTLSVLLGFLIIKLYFSSGFRNRTKQVLGISKGESFF